MNSENTPIDTNGSRVRDIVIVGNGGFARETKWIIDRINELEETWNFMGYIDNQEDSDVLGDDEYIEKYPEKLAVVVAIGTSVIRKNVIERYQKSNRNLYFPNIIDPSVLRSGSVRLGMGNIICAGTILTVDICIGNFNIINLDCTVGHGTMIDNYVTINPSVNLSGDTHVNDLVNLGTGVHVIQGKTIGTNTIVGAGAVVTENLPERCTAVGVPAKPIKFLGHNY